MTDERGKKAGLPERAHHADAGKPAAPRQRRMSAKKKQEAVLRVLRGEDLEVVSREVGTTAADLSAWRDSFLEAGAASLKSRPEHDRDRDLEAMRESRSSWRHRFELDGRRRDDDGQRAARGQDRPPGGRRPFSAAEIEAMSQTFSISVRRRYGLARLCMYWRVSRATLHRHLGAANRPDAPRRRRGPQGAMPDADLAERIRTLLADSPFHGEGYRKVWARLRYAGARTSPRRVLRVMREHGFTGASANGIAQRSAGA